MFEYNYRTQSNDNNLKQKSDVPFLKWRVVSAVTLFFTRSMIVTLVICIHCTPVHTSYFTTGRRVPVVRSSTFLHVAFGADFDF